MKFPFEKGCFDITVEGSIREDRYIDIQTTIAGRATKFIVDSQEKLIREALIRLGWRPPE